MSRIPSFLRFLGDLEKLWWMYSAMSISVVETILVLFGSETTVLSPVRTFLGLSILGYIPGYLTLRALLLSEELSALERYVMSVFLSVAVSVSIGIALGIGPFFQAANNIFALSIYSETIAVLAAYRIYRKALRRSELGGVSWKNAW